MLQRVDNAVFEFHSDECNVENCREMLAAVGLRTKGILKEDTKYKTIVEIFTRN